MSTRNCLRLACLLPVLAFADNESPQLGEELSAAEADAVSFTVMPDGAGLPAGAGTVATGEKIYLQQCVACHGVNGEGGPNDRLAGGHGSLQSNLPVKTIGSYWPYATTLFDYVRRAMPYTAPGSLDDDEVYAVTAYMLHLNGVIDGNAVMNAQSLPLVKMPNRDNFDWAWQP